MTSKITTITGPGGTGKTHTIKGLCESFSAAGRQVIYVTFNRDTANKTKDKINLQGVHISTIHALAYQELSKVGRVPEGFKAKTLDQAEPTASNESFKALIDTFLDFFITNDLPSFQEKTVPCGDSTRPGSGMVMFVDEFQNVGSDLMEILKLICSKHEVELYLVGDPNQALYGYSETHQTDNFGTIEETFGHKIDQAIHLRKNHRSNPSIQKVINGFLTKSLKTEQDGLYSVEDSVIEPQEIFFFTKREEEFEHVKEEALKWHEETGKKAAIIARSKRNMSLFLDWKERDNLLWLVVSTIHAYIGNEADRVFIVGFENPEEVDEARIYYTGFIRAKERLSLTTSFPVCDLSRTFDPATLTVTNRQRKVSRLLGPMKPIRTGQQLTREMFGACMIDSITLAVREGDIPFNKYIKPEGGIEANAYMKSQIITTPDGVVIKVSYNSGAGSYFFELKDVNLLRANWYSDSEVVSFLANFVLIFFNFQIEISQIHLQSIDLYKIVEEDHELIGLLKNEGIRFNSRLNDQGKAVTKFSMDEIKHRSVYYNFTDKKYKTLTLAVYRPITKENAGRLLDPKAIKLEFRYLRQAVEAKFAFGGDSVFRVKSGTKEKVVVSVDRLLRRLEDADGLLDSVYASTIRFRSIKAKKSRSGKRRSVKVKGGIEQVEVGMAMEAERSMTTGRNEGWDGQDVDVVVVEDTGMRALSYLYEIGNGVAGASARARLKSKGSGLFCGLHRARLGTPPKNTCSSIKGVPKSILEDPGLIRCPPLGQ